MSVIAPAALAVAIPIVFLYLVRWLDLYASGSFKTVVACFGGGLAAFFISLFLNSSIATVVGFGLAVVLVAPIVEEIFKSMTLVYYVRRPDFTYFVDGAIYGFAAGTAFAVVENLFYLRSTIADMSLLTALSRAFSTSLMHGSASALVGIALGWLRFGRGRTRFASLILGWGAAMALHLTFNNIVQRSEGIVAIVVLVLLGLGGVAMTAGFIFWGLAKEKRWLRDELKLDLGVSSGESLVVQRMEDLDVLLAPIGEHFGKKKQKQVEDFLKLQAQLGLKSKTQGMTQDDKLRAALAREIAEIRLELDKSRRSVGIYCMSFVRSILPPETMPMLERLSQMKLDREAMEKGSVYSIMTDRLGQRLARKQASSEIDPAPDGQV